MLNSSNVSDSDLISSSAKEVIHGGFIVKNFESVKTVLCEGGGYPGGLNFIMFYDGDNDGSAETVITCLDAVVTDFSWKNNEELSIKFDYSGKSIIRYDNGQKEVSYDVGAIHYGDDEKLIEWYGGRSITVQRGAESLPDSDMVTVVGEDLDDLGVYQIGSFVDNNFTLFDDNTGERIFDYDQGIFYF